MQGRLTSVPVPSKIAQTPGHYSIVGLLPEDHTFSKGSLFVLAPGTKCVVFDLDGMPQPYRNSPGMPTGVLISSDWKLRAVYVVEEFKSILLKSATIKCLIMVVPHA